VRRREFITLLGGAASALPLGARAEQAERVRRIGILTSGATADDPDGRVRTSAFLQGLHQSGWIDGRNIGLIIVGARAMPITCANTRRNWSRSRRT